MKLFIKSLGKTIGKHPTASHRLARIKNSPQFSNQEFKNVNAFSMYPDGGSTLQTAWNYLKIKKPVDIKPRQTIPSVKTDLLTLADAEPTIIWFGHSSYLIKFKNFTILVDPVFSGNASPLKPVVKAFAGTDVYAASDLPEVDLLLLTHDHYDHIDYETITQLKSAKQVICPLGVGEHLEYWGFSPSKITELDWWSTAQVSTTVKVTATPARHFSGRGLTRNKTLWSSFVLELSAYKIFIGGDSGYDDQFKKIGDLFKSFDLVFLECGQYNENWPHVHMFPEQTAQAAKDLNAKLLLPVHWGKFILSVHSWTEPIEWLLAKASELNVNLVTPKIGEIVRINSPVSTSSYWWRDV